MSTSLLDLSALRINGMDAAGTYADVLDALVTLTMRETITGASTVDMTLNDPHRTILQSSLLSQGSDTTTDTLGADKAGAHGLNGATMVLDGAGFELKAVRTSGSQLMLSWEAMAVAELRRKTGQKVVAAGVMTRAEFCATLIREVPWIRVAYAPGAKSLQQLARGSTTTATDTLQATDASAWGASLLGAALNVTSGDSILSDGERHSAGTATTSTSPVTTTAAASAPALPVARTAAEKKNLEDTWTACGRIMGEIGWRCMERRGGVILAPDAWLISHAPATYTLSQSTKGVDVIDVDWNVGKPAATATMQVWAGSADLVAGSAVTLTGLGPADGTWLVETIDRSASTKLATVTAIRPMTALAEPVDTSASGVGVGGDGGFGAGIATTGTAQVGSENSGPGHSKGEAFVQAALAQRGKQYVGGGHGPTVFDCSGLVQWAAAQVGVSFPAPVATQSLKIVNTGNLISVQQGIATRGAVLYRGTPGVNGGMSGSDHIAISLGNGQTIEARGRAYGVGVFPATGRSWSGAGIIPGIGAA